MHEELHWAARDEQGGQATEGGRGEDQDEDGDDDEDDVEDGDTYVRRGGGRDGDADWVLEWEWGRDEDAWGKQSDAPTLQKGIHPKIQGSAPRCDSANCRVAPGSRNGL